MWRRIARLVGALLVGAAGAWVGTGPGLAEPEAPAAYRWPLLDWMPPPPVPVDNPMSTAKVELGRHLFYDVRVAGLNYMSCATCHRPELAFSDGRKVAIGLTGQLHPRNSQGLANAAYLPALTWADPGVASLEEQAKLPLFGERPVEMMANGREDAIVARLEVDLGYRRRFAAAFPESGGRIDYDAIRRALAAFERTILSFDSPWDRWRHGGDVKAVDPAAKRGEALFLGERLRCGRCHVPPLFTDAATGAGYHNTGLYDLDGQGGLPAGNQGLIEHTGRPADMGRFRTPSLRNVAVTAPYMHDGSAATMGQVVDDYAAGGRAARTGTRSPLTSPLVAGFTLSAEERADLLAFLDALTDRAFLDSEALRSPFR